MTLYGRNTEQDKNNLTIDNIMIKATKIEEKHEKRTPKREIYRGKKFILVVHGARTVDLNKLKKWFDNRLENHPWNSSYEDGNGPSVVPEITSACISKEFGKNKIHPHWQVYFETSSEWRIKGHIKAFLGHENFHVERAKGTKEANVRYVFGVDKSYEMGWIAYKKNVIVPRDYSDRAYKFWKNFKPRDWQAELIPLITKEDVDAREVVYIYDEIGNTGKTKLAEYLHIYYAAVVTGGKSADMKHAITRWSEIVSKYPTVIIVDICRSETFVDYTGIESIKNGLFFSGKYESAMLHSFRKPNVLVFSNFPPSRSYLSSDRWKVGKITDGKIIWK